MKRYIHAFAMCQSMFCAIPCPWNIWDENARDKMLLFLPIVGLEIGIFWAGLGWLVNTLALPSMIRAMILCVFPFLATGYIHLDGYMDVTDAVKSCRSLERRREILKDSHVGSFAVINLCLLMLAQFACFAAVKRDLWVLTFIPAVSRCGSALAITVLKPMSTSQYAGQAKPKGRIAALGAMLVAFLVAGFLLCGADAVALVGALAGYGMALRKGYRSLDGMNGDISGYALTISELCGVAVLSLLGGIL